MPCIPRTFRNCTDTVGRLSRRLCGAKTRRVPEPLGSRHRIPPAVPAPSPEVPPMRLRAPGRAAPRPARPPLANDSPLAALPRCRHPGLRAQTPREGADRGLGVRGGWRSLRPGSHLPGRRCRRADEGRLRRPSVARSFAPAATPSPDKGLCSGSRPWDPHRPPPALQARSLAALTWKCSAIFPERHEPRGPRAEGRGSKGAARARPPRDPHAARSQSSARSAWSREREWAGLKGWRGVSSGRLRPTAGALLLQPLPPQVCASDLCPLTHHHDPTVRHGSRHIF